MKWTFSKNLSRLSIAVFLSSLSAQTFASDYNIPFISAAGLGNVYAGWAADANDASTAFANPAGLTRLKRQQLVVSAIGVTGATRFTGSETTPPYPFPGGSSESGGASSQLRGLLPAFFYSYPINDRFVVAFGQNVPFALGTNYKKDSVVRYAATRTQIVDLNIGPSLGIKLNEQVSVGAGFDINRVIFKINNMVGLPISSPDGESQNHFFGWGYGWHGGILYQPWPTTRFGASYNSQVMLHTTGDSIFYGPPSLGGEVRVTNQRAAAALPARIQVSGYHEITDRIAAMATIFYTNWRELGQLTMQNVVLPGGSTTSVTIPFGFHNTFDYSVGLNFKATEKWLLRTGLDFYGAPSNNQNRNAADPIGNALIFGIGTHYQQNPCLGYDIGYAHAFFQNTHINVANALTTLSGHSSQNTNVFGAQVTWNI